MKFTILFFAMIASFTICLFTYPAPCPVLALLVAISLVLMTDNGKEKDREQMVAFVTDRFNESMDNIMLTPDQRIDTDHLQHMDIDELHALYTTLKQTA
jgi:hypothetical protein